MTRNSKDSIIIRIGIQAVLISVAVICLFPFVWLISSSLKTQDTIFSDMGLIPKTFEFANYVQAWTQGNFGQFFINSIFYTITVILFLIIFASMAAYAFSRLEFFGKDFFFYLFIGVMMIPIPGAFVAIVVVLNKLGLINSRLGYILPQINAGLPFAIYMLKTFFDKLPKELEESARIDGCSKWQIYWHISLPLAKSAIAVIVIFQALTIWNEFLLAKLIFFDAELMPLQVGLFYFQGERITAYPLLMAGTTITMIPIVIIYLIMQKFIIRGITEGAIKG